MGHQALKKIYQPAFKMSEELKEWHETDLFFSTVKSMSGNLRHVFMTGGEPFMIKSNYHLIDYFLQKQFNKHIKFHISSNITVWSPSLLKKICKFKTVMFYASIDAVGKRNDWLRSPSHFSKIEKNMEKLLEFGKNIQPYINCTVSVYNVFYMDELIEWSQNLAKKLQALVPEIRLNMVHQPEFQHISVLTKPLKMKVIELYKRLLSNTDIQMEQGELQAIINILRDSIEDTDRIIKLRAILKAHTEFFDRYRKESFGLVFPELKELWH